MFNILDGKSRALKNCSWVIACLFESVAGYNVFPGF